MIENATGIILRTRPLTDTSFIIHWLTPDFGRLATVAKGARRAKSPFAGKLDLFYLADFSFLRSRRSELHNLREVNLKDTHAGLRRELDYVLQASYCTALVEQTTEMETPLPETFELMSGFLKHLPQHPPLPQMLFGFEVKLLSEQGLQPDLENDRIGPDLKQILRILLVSDWDSMARLKLTPQQVTGLRQFLHGFLIYHLGKVPRSRPSH
ncbi:DNA repair protein RecO [Pedosphaera parvula]|uniref:DNA repair protein RecO n=1 Tax=Pedosphaera parvula (strain Ellin514) TaxID=320771 RepID=B9XS07_PEDPL|nr:DNA repair protein RecO [Pedosphaera parvula]EEF57378.1 DNA repair protein RecO [Pedosphaera parvula Ellin514]